MSDNNATSTLSSYINSAAGAIQSGVAAVTGSSADKVITPAPYPGTIFSNLFK